MKNKNLILFVVVVFVLFLFSFSEKDKLDYERYPWHVLPWKNLDSLSEAYSQKYEVLKDSDSVAVSVEFDKAVFILVDAWGLPLDDSLFADDLSVFGKLKVLIHRRELNQTKWVERHELKNRTKDGVYFFGGDSLEYNRKSYIQKLGFTQTVFCQKCSDEVMIGKLDSALSVENPAAVMAWITQSSRVGDFADIRNSLKQIADLATKHPDVRFVVQGTHRPILGTPETRKKYYAHWVPVVVLN